MTANPAQPTTGVFGLAGGVTPAGSVHYDAKQQSWQVLGHPEAVAVLSDPATFSSDLTGLVPAQDDLALFQKGNFVRMDPPRHRKLRGLVSQAFTPRWWPAWNRASPRSPPNCSMRPAVASGWT